MGRAARWLKALLGGKKAAAVDEPKPFREKKRWGFVKSFREKDKSTETEPPPPLVAASYRVVSGDADAQNKRAIAVAAATAAVAEAAVAAAQAAAAVVRLTSSGRIAGVGGAKSEEPAAVKIQAAFRGYLARRALRALKALVKLQAIVRGNIVRRQAAETMRCMQALVRVQARARACRALRSDRNTLKFGSHNHPGPATPEKFEQSIQSNPRRSSPLKRNSSKQASFSDGFDQDRAQSSSAFKWLGQWMEESYLEPISKSSAIAMSSPLDDEKSAKILEIDTGKPNHHNSNKRKNNSLLHSLPLSSDVQCRSFTTMMLDSPSKDSTAAQLSVPSPSSVCMQEPLSPLQFPIVEGSDYALSPHFFSAYSSRPVSSRRGGPVTPAKSDCSRSLFSECSDCPSYMANTESSRAKWRSQSAPKQRPEFEKSSSVVRRLSGTGAGQRSSSSLHAKFANKAYPGSGRLDRLGMPLRI